jgi:serine/threonine protein kinase
LKSADVVSGLHKVSCNGISLFFAAPEKLLAFMKKNDISSNAKMDVYSFGMVFYELLTRKHCFTQKDFDINKIIEGKRPDLNFNLNFSQDSMKIILNILTGCWHSNNQERNSMDEICYSIECVLNTLE